MENKKILSKGFAFLFITFSIFSFLFSANLSFAQNTDYKLLAPIPGFDETYKTGDIGKYVNAIVRLSIVIAAVLAVVMITLGGFQYMTSESMGLKQEGKDKIKNAFLGLVILASSYLILNTINPALLNFNLNIQTVGVPGNTINPQSSSQTTRQEIQQSVNERGLGTGLDPNRQYQLIEPSGINQRNLTATQCEAFVNAKRAQGITATCQAQ